MMNQQQTQSAPDDMPGGVLNNVKSGFDLTTRYIWLIILPLLLDVFLWTGPRQSIAPVIESYVSALRASPFFISEGAADFDLLADALLEQAPDTNLYYVLHVPLVGLPVLSSSAVAADAPLARPVDEISGFGSLFGLSVAYFFSGILLGMAYLGQIAQVVRDGELNTVRLLRRMGINWIQFSLIFIVLLIAGVILSIPLGIAAALASFISPFLGTLVLLVGSVLFFSLLVYSVFTLHGIVMAHRPVLRALWESWQIVRRSRGAAMGLFLLYLIAGVLLDLVWGMIDSGSWFALVTLAGHAYVTTALIAASFIFYQERFAQLQAASLPASASMEQGSV